MLNNFVRGIAGCSGEWTMAAYKDEAIAAIQQQVGPEGRVICGLSGGVDSSVAAVLIHEAIGERLTCVFVDTGMMRHGEADEVVSMFRDNYNIKLIHQDASDLFIDALDGIDDPEVKRKTIGKLFIDVFDEADEVRALGQELGLPTHFVGRHPFPGPGLAIRIPGAITRDKLDTLRAADRIYLDEIRKAGLYDTIWQAFAVLLPVKTVGVMGDGRTYDHVCALRAVTSTDGMTADYYPYPHDFLGRTANRIINEVNGINRVVYDITSKPPGTIEWE